MSENRINLTETCQAAEWHLATTIDILHAANLSREDAEAFAAFAFAERGGGDSAQEVTDEQWDRLELSANNGWDIKPSATAARTDSEDALRSLLGSIMTQDAGMLEVSINRAHRVLGIDGDEKDIDGVLKLFGWDRKATA